MDAEVDLSGLTATERRVVEYYSERGGKAKDIAMALGISERTVYKALYKYRKLLRERGYDVSGLYLRRQIQQPPVAPKNITEELAKVIKHSLIPVIIEEVRKAVSAELKRIMLAGSPSEEADDAGRLARSMERLNTSINRLNENIVKLSNIIREHDSRGAGEGVLFSGGENDSEAQLPSYVVDNPWMEVLRFRT